MNDTTRAPYPGLRAYERDETDLFFGREGCVNEMVDVLAATHFLAVLGTSGSGKSSLVRTGLLDGLELGLYRAAGSRWSVADCHPGGDAIRHLAAGLLAARGEAAVEPFERESLETFLRRGPRAIVEWLDDGNLPQDGNLLILVDQFEELFRYGDYAGREEAEAFVALLLESVRSHRRIHVVITMRSEYLGACALVPGLAERINASLYLTRRMTREECRQAIEGPAGVANFDIEPELVTRLLNELSALAPWEADRNSSQLQRLARQADQLPLMQHVLSRLWQRARQRAGDARPVLTLRDYEDIGQMRCAVEQHAGEVNDRLDPTAKAVVPRVFRALVAGTTLADAVRRPMRFVDLCAVTGSEPARVREVVDAFRARDCNFLRPAEGHALADSTIVDVSHESLIRQWSSLSEWFEAEVAAEASALVNDLIGDAKAILANSSDGATAIIARRSWFRAIEATPEDVPANHPVEEQLRRLLDSQRLSQEFLRRFPSAWVASSHLGEIDRALAGVLLRLGRTREAVAAAQGGAEQFNKACVQMLADWYRTGAGPVALDLAKATRYDTMLSSRTWGYEQYTVQAIPRWDDSGKSIDYLVFVEDPRGKDDDFMSRFVYQFEFVEGVKLPEVLKTNLTKLMKIAQEDKVSFKSLTMYVISPADALTFDVQQALPTKKPEEVAKIILAAWSKDQHKPPDVVKEGLSRLVSNNEGSDFTPGLLGAAIIIAQGGNMPAARTVLDAAALKKNLAADTLATMLSLRGYVLAQLGDAQLSEADYATVLSIEPDNASVLAELGHAWADQAKNLPSAVLQLQRAVKLEPENADIRGNLGWAQVQSGDTETGLATLQSAAAASSAAPDIQAHLGDTFRRLGRKDEARAALANAAGMSRDASLTAYIHRQQALLGPAAQ